MEAFAIIVIAIYAAGAAALAVGLWAAPEGYQDDSGFHLGRPGAQPDGFDAAI